MVFKRKSTKTTKTTGNLKIHEICMEIHGFQPKSVDFAVFADFSDLPVVFRVKIHRFRPKSTVLHISVVSSGFSGQNLWILQS